MSDLVADIGEIQGRAVTSVMALGGRQILVHGLNLTGNILLARFLSPVDFGVYAVVIFLITFLNTFGGTGLASNLIRSIASPSEEEYSALFTAQQALLSVVTLLLVLLAPVFTLAYHLPVRYNWLFRMAALSLLITSLGVMPQIKLERDLRFSKLAIAEVWQAVVFNGTAVALAWRGLGGLAFGIALLARSVTGVVAIYRLQPWRPSWNWDSTILREHLSFGLFYQLSQILSLVKDAVSPLLLGLVLGAASVGYTSWASMLASYPVLALIILQRIYLPVFARLQHEPASLQTFVEKVILATNAIAAPVAVFSLALIHPITNLIYGAKWAVAIPLYILFWTTNLFSPTATPLLGLLNALGFSRTVLAFTTLWMIMTWGIGIPLVLRMGTMGLAWANVCVQVSNIALFLIARQKLPVRILHSVLPSWALAIFLGFLLWRTNSIWPAHSSGVLTVYLLTAMVLFGFAMLLWFGRDFRRLLRLVGNRRA